MVYRVINTKYDDTVGKLLITRYKNRLLFKAMYSYNQNIRPVKYYSANLEVIY